MPLADSAFSQRHHEVDVVAALVVELFGGIIGAHFLFMIASNRFVLLYSKNFNGNELRKGFLQKFVLKTQFCFAFFQS